MKLATSYFYQIRNFKKNMLPVSTAIWDPKWFHADTGDYNYMFQDKRGILNGLRCLPIIECGRAANSCHGPEQCEDGPAAACQFLKDYRENLNKIDFQTLIGGIKCLEDWYQKEYNINDEITIVFIVYETPDNPCSERLPIQELFKKNGFECNELEYPIEKLEIQQGDFSF